MTRPIILALLVISMAASLGACGRRGALDAPDGTTYPKDYPVEYNAPKDEPDPETKK